MNSILPFKTLSLFSGIDGISLGLEWTGYYETVAFCEADKKVALVLNRHWPTLPVYEDVRDLSGERLWNDGITQIDVIVGGFPCQDISTAGPGEGISGERSGLWKEFARLIGEIQPQYAIIENVAALRYKGKGLYRVLADLAEIGYDAEWHCISASAVGAPHQRDRIWIIAYPHKFNGNNRRYEPSEICRKRPSEAFLQRSKFNVPNTHSKRQSQSEGPQQEQWRWFVDRTNENAPDSSSNKLQRKCNSSENQSANESQKRSKIARSFDKIRYQWQTEPDVGRMADGFPGRVDRLKQLGNAVVPQIPYLIGLTIIEKHFIYGPE